MARYEDSSETLLVALAQNGDRDALEELLRHAYRLLRTYVGSLTNSTDADDLLQEIALRIVQHLRHLRHPAAFRAWIFQIATRHVFRHLKRESRWTLQRADSSLALDIPAPVPVPDSIEPMLLSLIDRLSPSSRAVILLHYEQHLSLDETAAVLDIPIGTAKSRLAYGISVLRKLMKETGAYENRDRPQRRDIC